MTESSNPKFKKGLVIFIDILGSENQNDFAKLYEINNTFHSMLIDNGKNDKEHVVYQRTIHTFSDCAYIIYDFKDGVPPSFEIFRIQSLRLRKYSTYIAIWQVPFANFF